MGVLALTPALAAPRPGHGGGGGGGEHGGGGGGGGVVGGGDRGGGGSGGGGGDPNTLPRSSGAVARSVNTGHRYFIIGLQKYSLVAVRDSRTVECVSLLVSLAAPDAAPTGRENVYRHRYFYLLYDVYIELLTLNLGPF